MTNIIRRSGLYKWARAAYHNIETKKFLAEDGAGYFCPGCKKNWKAFRPFPKEWLTNIEKQGWPYKLEDAETLNFENYSCYGCGITDRDRLYTIFFEEKLDSKKHYDIVEFAPTPALSKVLNKMPNVTHRTSDLFMDDVDDKLDIQDLNIYRTNSFDVFICSHILEHVDNDIKAMKELYRILKPGGFGIAMVPIINKVVSTHEDPSIKSEALRIKYFGQLDHVRLYAKDQFIQRLESVGFKVKLYGVEHFGEAIFNKCGITKKSLLYIVEKY